MKMWQKKLLKIYLKWKWCQVKQCPKRRGGEIFRGRERERILPLVGPSLLLLLLLLVASTSKMSTIKVRRRGRRQGDPLYYHHHYFFHWQQTTFSFPNLLLFFPPLFSSLIWSRAGKIREREVCKYLIFFSFGLWHLPPLPHQLNGK